MFLTRRRTLLTQNQFTWRQPTVLMTSYLSLLPLLLLIQSPFNCSSRFSRAAQMIGARVVDTQYGKLRGVVIERPGRHLPPVEAFLGVQYATVLNGDLRFMPPTSTMQKWEGIRVAMKHRPVCPQRIPDFEELARRMPRGRVDQYRRLAPFLEKQHEECLSLNVYVPTFTGRL